MALSDTAPRVPTDAGRHLLRCVTLARHLPAMACNAVRRSPVIKRGRTPCAVSVSLPFRLPTFHDGSGGTEVPTTG
jgi:hypothetical protein